MNRREIAYAIVYTNPAVNIWDALWDPAKPYKVYRVWMEIVDRLKKVNIAHLNGVHRRLLEEVV